MWGPRGSVARGAKARRSPLPLRPKNGVFGAQQSTPIPSKVPRSELGPLIKGKRGPLELDGSPDEEPMGPRATGGPKSREKMDLSENHGAPWS